MEESHLFREYRIWPMRCPGIWSHNHAYLHGEHQDRQRLLTDCIAGCCRWGALAIEISIAFWTISNLPSVVKE